MMAKRPVERGPASARVAENVRVLREARKLSLREVSERMEELGRRMIGSGVQKVEQGGRRVDADDLVALSLALDVTPNRLLLPGSAGDEEVEITPTVLTTSRAAWRWAAGEVPLLAHPWMVWDAPRSVMDDPERVARFDRENRPHDPKEALGIDKVHEYADVLDPIVEAVEKAREAGLSMSTIISYVELRVGRNAERRQTHEWLKGKLLPHRTDDNAAQEPGI